MPGCKFNGQPQTCCIINAIRSLLLIRYLFGSELKIIAVVSDKKCNQKSTCLEHIIFHCKCFDYWDIKTTNWFLMYLLLRSYATLYVIRKNDFYVDLGFWIIVMSDLYSYSFKDTKVWVMRPILLLLDRNQSSSHITLEYARLDYYMKEGFESEDHSLLCSHISLVSTSYVRYVTSHMRM